MKRSFGISYVLQNKCHKNGCSVNYLGRLAPAIV